MKRAKAKKSEPAEIAWSEIERLYPDHFLVLGPFTRDRRGNYLSGVVLSAGETRDEAYRILKDTAVHHVAFVTTKKPRDDIHYIV